jgi:hypothetical protein
MIRAELRAAISRAGAFPTIAAAGDLSAVLPAELSDHIHAVYQRLETAVGDKLAFAAPLRLAVLVHEERPERLPALLERLGLSDYSRIVVAVIGAFGRLWKLQDERDAVNYVSAHRAYLEPLLLFELAHEGTPTASMRQIAELGGLGSSFQRWAALLGPPVPSAVGREGS